MEADFNEVGIVPTSTGSYLLLKMPYDTIMEWLGTLNDGRTYTVKITEKRQRRSLDANALYWELCGRLAKKLGMAPEDVYRQHIKGLGNYTTLCMQNEIVDAFSALWIGDHSGRAIATRESKIPGCTTVLAYYGSSDFNQSQMYELISACIKDCQANGVETRPQEEVYSLLEAWPKVRKDHSNA